MDKKKFFKLDSTSNSETWRQLQKYSKIITAISSKFIQHNKNWEEHSLKYCLKGLTTNPMNIDAHENTELIEIVMDVINCEILVISQLKTIVFKFNNLSENQFAQSLNNSLVAQNLKVDFLKDNIYDSKIVELNKEFIASYKNIIDLLYIHFTKIKNSTLYESSSIQLWPHHFDFAMLLFTGNTIENQDIKDWSNSREQINVGFSLGDSLIDEPYFYITFYPNPKGFKNYNLPVNAYWQTESWNGAVLKYSALGHQKKANSILEEFLFTSLKVL